MNPPTFSVDPKKATDGSKPAFKTMAQKKAEANDPVKKGEKVYNKTCIACHGTGLTNAAKLTEKERWAGIAKKGMDTLLKQAIEGFQGTEAKMPPKGGNTDLTDGEVHDAIIYMLHASGAKVE